ncbi:Shikimate kinase [Allomuricauda ruestringensis DSM 13258]|uniref:Shikimate kinase n=1 Tax=Allomuricauda ruestringensis (strain DSM 13258 / CIP 107369 / LMG 19739 / B1) TaxID=886377 RepID=G2PMW2_ALLRU|nr:shikimate kinase [Allomuricauda ruestringensis]AEM71274.1 Shikimate kinase [Allomuricauda ruestringensis DSM 13258]
MKIVLVGYMASGKSTVGRLLARQLGVEFIDLDDYIEQHQKKSIKTIFSEKGEIFFRKLEHQMLAEVLEKEKSIILSTGGGTPCYGTNMVTILNQSDHSIYLNLSIPNLVERISKEKDNRPLVKNIADEELPEFIGKHLFERRPYYLQAKHILDCNNLDAETVVGRIKELL